MSSAWLALLGVAVLLPSREMKLPVQLAVDIRGDRKKRTQTVVLVDRVNRSEMPSCDEPKAPFINPRDLDRDGEALVHAQYEVAEVFRVLFRDFADEDFGEDHGKRISKRLLAGLPVNGNNDQKFLIRKPIGHVPNRLIESVGLNRLYVAQGKTTVEHEFVEPSFHL